MWSYLFISVIFSFTLIGRGNSVVNESRGGIMIIRGANSIHPFNSLNRPSQLFGQSVRAVEYTDCFFAER